MFAVRFQGNPFQPFFLKRLQQWPVESLTQLKILNESAFRLDQAPTPRHVQVINGTKVNVSHIGEAKHAAGQDGHLMKLFKTIVNLRRRIVKDVDPKRREQAQEILDGLHNAINIVTKSISSARPCKAQDKQA